MSTTGRQSFAHIWLCGDRIACMSCGDLAGDIEFVEPGWPLCAPCRTGDPREHDGRMYCEKHRVKRGRR